MQALYIVFVHVYVFEINAIFTTHNINSEIPYPVVAHTSFNMLTFAIKIEN